MKPDRRQLRERLADYYSDEKIRVWLTSPHPQLNGETPQDALNRGDAESVHRILDRLDADAYL